MSMSLSTLVRIAARFRCLTDEQFVALEALVLHGCEPQSEELLAEVASVLLDVIDLSEDDGPACLMVQPERRG